MSEHAAARPATDVEWFQANGRGTGIGVLVLWAVIAVLDVVYGGPLALIAGLLVAAVLTYVAMIRPQVGMTSEDLVYRQMFSDLRIPLASIEAVEISRYFQVTVAGKRYISPAVGRSRRRVRRSALDARLGHLAAGKARDEGGSYADVVQDATRSRITDAKARPRSGGTTEGIRRSWAPIEIAVSVAAVAFLLVCLAI